MYFIQMKEFEETRKKAQFLADAMFGKLGSWLRMFGFDVLKVRNQWDDSYVIEIARDQHCHLLTRDHELYLRYKSQIRKKSLFPLVSCYIPYDTIEYQLAGFFACFQLNPKDFLWNNPEDLPFSPRCSKCNGLIVPVEKNKILKDIPQKTALHFNRYWRCSNPECHKIYWRGSHWGEISLTLQKSINILTQKDQKTLFEC